MPAVVSVTPVFELELGSVPIPVDQDKRVHAAALDKQYASETRIPSAEANDDILGKREACSITHFAGFSPM